MTISRLNSDTTYLPAFRNLIINGAMQVAQRGTSLTGQTALNGFPCVDRFAFFQSGTGTLTFSQENDAPTGFGFRKSLKVLATTGNNSLSSSAELLMIHRMEGQNLQSIKKGTANAEQLTISFWVKSNVTGTYIVALEDVDNSRYVAQSYTIASSGTWEKKTIVFPADTTGAFDNDNGLSLQLLMWLAAGTNSTSGTLNTTWASTVTANRAVGQTNLAAATNNYWQITGVQLEVGAVATPFEFKPFAQDLLECQRYFYSVTQNPLGVNLNASDGYSSVIAFPTTMRAVPTLSNGSLANGSSPAITNGKTERCLISFSGATTNSQQWLTGQFSSEL
jgi:hypothetical protein